MTKLKALKKQYQQALKKLEQALDYEEKEIIRDSAIKRFEFTFDLAWKTIKAHLEQQEGIQCSSPKKCFRQAYQVGLLDYDEVWLAMTDLRNEAVHTYSDEFAKKLYRKLPELLEYFKRLENTVTD